ncbi:hypothetical protein [Cyanobacterium aponinum]
MTPAERKLWSDISATLTL